jgi:hypothetical protein
LAAGKITANLVTLSGSGFTLPGRTPVVMFGGQPASLDGSSAATSTSLSMVLPDTLDAGPNEDVQVVLSGKTGSALTFTASPWLSSLAPIRAALDAAQPPLVLNGIGFTAAPQAVRLDGTGGTTNITAFVGNVTNTKATITLPTSLPNGLYQVRIVLADAGNSVSNARTLEIIPLLQAPVGVATITVSGHQVHQLTLKGARLKGTDIRVVIDGIGHQAAANANPSQLVFALGRLLDSGSHTVAVVIDGSRSHDLALEVA